MKTKYCLLFDWGNTLMKVFPDQRGPMKHWSYMEEVSYVGETLRKLQPQWHLAMATNAEDSDENDIREVIRRMWPDIQFDAIYCYRRIGYKKPSPEYFRYIVNDLVLPAYRIIMIGDDFEADVEGAQRAGLQAVWFNPEGKNISSHRHIRQFSDFRELPALLGQWFSPE